MPTFVLFLFLSPPHPIVVLLLPLLLTSLPEAAGHVRTHLLTAVTLATETAVAEHMNWNVFDFCNQFLQTAALLQRATHELCTRMACAHNVAVVEVRFCPALHTLGGLTADAAVAAVVAGFRQAQGELAVACPGRDDLVLPLRGGVIVCALRSHAEDEMLRMADLAAAWLGRGVIGFDVGDKCGRFVGFRLFTFPLSCACLPVEQIAGDEGAYPLSRCTAAIACAARHGVPVTVHAGEWLDSTDNLRLALTELPGITRIGHGVCLRGQPELLALAAQKNVCLEVCLTSNVRAFLPFVLESLLRTRSK